MAKTKEKWRRKGKEWRESLRGRERLEDKNSIWPLAILAAWRNREREFESEDDEDEKERLRIEEEMEGEGEKKMGIGP